MLCQPRSFAEVIVIVRSEIVRSFSMPLARFAHGICSSHKWESRTQIQRFLQLRRSVIAMQALVIGTFFPFAEQANSWQHRGNEFPRPLSC